MKHHLLTTIAAVVLVGCGPSVDIWTAAEQGDIKAVKQHLAAGTDVNAKDDKIVGYPLHFAASGGHKEIVELLIANGADVNAKTGDGRTPLDHAEFSSDDFAYSRDIDVAKKETADLLRKHGGKTSEELKAEGK